MSAKLGPMRIDGSALSATELPDESAARLTLVRTALAIFADSTRSYEEQKEALNEIFTRAYLQKLMAAANGNQSLAARIAKLDRTYLGRLLLKYGMRA